MKFSNDSLKQARNMLNYPDIDIEPSKEEYTITIEWLRSENAFLRGKIEVYEKFLKDKGYIKEEE